jgi:excisionase family DNA binding protein
MSTNHSLPDPSTRPTLTVDEAAAFLGVSRCTAYLAANSGQLPTLRIGRRLLVPTAALLRLLQLDSQAVAQ